MTSQCSRYADPILTGFDGRSFEFVGEVGAYYNVISEKQHQVGAKSPIPYALEASRMFR